MLVDEEAVEYTLLCQFLTLLLPWSADTAASYVATLLCLMQRHQQIVLSVARL